MKLSIAAIAIALAVEVGSVSSFEMLAGYKPATQVCSMFRLCPFVRLEELLRNCCLLLCQRFDPIDVFSPESPSALESM